MTVPRVLAPILVLLVGCGQPAPSETPGATTLRTPPASAEASDAPDSTVAVSASTAPTTPAPPSGAWVTIAPMPSARSGFEPVVLADGTLLAIGDHQDCAPGGAEPGAERVDRYDPTLDTWTAVAPLDQPRKLVAAIATPDGGALAVGGVDVDDVALASTLRFDPASATWSAGAPLSEPASGVRLHALPDGAVLAVGGAASSTLVERSGTGADPWVPLTTGGSLQVDQSLLLADGQLLLSGSSETSSGDFIVDLAAGTAQQVADRPADSFGDVLVALPGGDALLLRSIEMGGPEAVAVASTWRFDRAAAAWGPVADRATIRIAPTVLTLPDGRVLVAGGMSDVARRDGVTVLASTEVYEPATDAWTPGPELRVARYDAEGAILADGSVLILGGTDELDQGDTPFCPGHLTSGERWQVGG